MGVAFSNSEIIASKLVSECYNEWGNDDVYGFSAIPSGFYYSSSEFRKKNVESLFLTTTSKNDYRLLEIILTSDSVSGHYDPIGSYKYPVRCIKD